MALLTRRLRDRNASLCVLRQIVKADRTDLAKEGERLLGSAIPAG
jgi:hypothetical protein